MLITLFVLILVNQPSQPRDVAHWTKTDFTRYVTQQEEHYRLIFQSKKITPGMEIHNNQLQIRSSAQGGLPLLSTIRLFSIQLGLEDLRQIALAGLMEAGMQDSDLDHLKNMLPEAQTQVDAVNQCAREQYQSAEWAVIFAGPPTKMPSDEMIRKGLAEKEDILARCDLDFYWSLLEGLSPNGRRLFLTYAASRVKHAVAIKKFPDHEATFTQTKAQFTAYLKENHP